MCAGGHALTSIARSRAGEVSPTSGDPTVMPQGGLRVRSGAWRRFSITLSPEHGEQLQALRLHRLGARSLAAQGAPRLDLQLIQSTALAIARERTSDDERADV